MFKKTSDELRYDAGEKSLLLEARYDTRADHALSLGKIKSLLFVGHAHASYIEERSAFPPLSHAFEPAPHSPAYSKLYAHFL